MTDDGDFFGITEEEQFRDWLDWGEGLVAVISLASQRLGLAIAAAGFAIAGSNMIEKAPILGQASLGIAVVFGVWIAVASLRGVAGR